MPLTFEWDHEKARSNESKHGVTFDEASGAFGDIFSITIPDPLHSTDEYRFVLIGQSHRGRLLVVVHTDRNNRVRIISARTATGSERRNYEESTR
ncbi:MAG: BrnT family toxin [Spirochaeta sp.]|jgi:uncharacterized DUF497 family protein|nr:BrnT family toxin [Spirochaeta sp.]